VLTPIAAIGCTLTGVDLSFLVSVLGCTACTIVQFHFPGRMCWCAPSGPSTA
jgi:hypothetical protein